MKITRLQVINNPILGDFDLSFATPDGTPIDTVIFAGENGSGKTTLMSLIARTLFIEANPVARPERHEVWITLTDEEVRTIQTHFTFMNLNANVERQIKLIRDFNWANNWEGLKVIVNLNLQQSFDGHLFATLGLFRTIYSDVAINFEAREIQNSTTQDIDIGTGNNVRSNSELAYSVTQLLVDIANSDNADLADWVREHPALPVPEHERDRRIKRFTRAFETIFPNKRYFKVATREGSIAVIFREHGREIKLKDFSSGEKQIVFRGSFFLKDKARNDGVVVFIDEPEISLHPRWQLSILDYYKNLFTNEIGVQTSQLFVATHSPFIIHNENRRNDKVFVLERSPAGAFMFHDEHNRFFDWSPEQIVRDTFGINLIAIERNVVFVEGELDELYFNSTRQAFNRQDLNFEIKWIGRMVNGQAEFTGETALTNARHFYAAHQQLMVGKVIIYYDNDCNKADETVGQLMVRSAPTAFQNPVFTKGIESLLNLSQEFINQSYFHREKRNGNGGITEIREPDKRTLYNLVAAQEDMAPSLTTLNDQLTRLNDLLGRD